VRDAGWIWFGFEETVGVSRCGLACVCRDLWRDVWNWGRDGIGQDFGFLDLSRFGIWANRRSCVKTRSGPEWVECPPDPKRAGRV
jgi:hypothetical protein